MAGIERKDKDWDGTWSVAEIGLVTLASRRDLRAKGKQGFLEVIAIAMVEVGDDLRIVFILCDFGFWGGVW
jgi:hypothetical protein